jgi:ferredoxin
MKVNVDYGLCESNGVCVAHAPEIFEIRDDDFLYLLQEDVPPELAEAAEAAVVGCPRQAIRLAR